MGIELSCQSELLLAITPRRSVRKDYLRCGTRSKAEQLERIELTTLKHPCDFILYVSPSL